MPFARFEVDFLHEHFAEVPAKERPQAIALYFGLVDVSARMLLDGRISLSTLHAVGDESGVILGAKKGRERDKTVGILVGIGLLERDENGTFCLPLWAEHHRSRHDVTEDRKAAAERKRRSRGQLSLPTSRAMSQRDVTEDVTPGQARDSRAHARGRSETETETEEPLLQPKPPTHPELHDGEPALGGWVGGDEDEEQETEVEHARRRRGSSRAHRDEAERIDPAALLPAQPRGAHA